MKKTLSAFSYLLSVVTVCAAAQQSSTPAAALASRAFLEQEAARLGAQSAEAARIRERLDAGDFQVGDQIYIAVAGEEQLTDTFTVRDGLELSFPQIGTMSLKGVLRSELQEKVNTHLAQYVRAPSVEVRPLMRLVVDGQVLRPGVYAAAPDQPLADLITTAGGFTQVARATHMRVERGGSNILSGARLQEALGRGYSLDRLSLRAGDRVFVPSRGDSERTLRIVGLILSVPVAILAITRVF